jgi:hypothetical protein
MEATEENTFSIRLSLGNNKAVSNKSSKNRNHYLPVHHQHHDDDAPQPRPPLHQTHTTPTDSPKSSTSSKSQNESLLATNVGVGNSTKGTRRSSKEKDAALHAVLPASQASPTRTKAQLYEEAMRRLEENPEKVDEIRATKKIVRRTSLVPEQDLDLYPPAEPDCGKPGQLPHLSRSHAVDTTEQFRLLDSERKPHKLSAEFGYIYHITMKQFSCVINSLLVGIAGHSHPIQRLSGAFSWIKE